MSTLSVLLIDRVRFLQLKLKKRNITMESVLKILIFLY